MMATALRRPTSARLPVSFQAPARAAWAAAFDKLREPVGMVMDVSQALSRLGLEHFTGHLEAGSLFRVDIVLNPQYCGGRKVSTCSLVS
jgi:hypothetical protein